MLRYLYIKQLEIPGEKTLGIFISGCQVQCKGCPTRELWEDKGTVLGLTELQYLLNQYPDITCLCLYGGTHDIDGLIELFMYAHKRIKTAWYCGLDMLPKDKKGIMFYLDYLRLGHYDAELGGLNSPTTNQCFYKIYPDGDGVIMADNTKDFWKDDTVQG